MPASCGACRAPALARADRQAAPGARPPAAVHRADAPRRCAAACWSRRRRTTSSAPSTTPSTASSRAAPMLEITMPTLADASAGAARQARAVGDRAVRALRRSPAAGTAARAALHATRHRYARALRAGAARLRSCAVRAARRRRTSSASFASAAATGITPSWRSTSSSWCARCRARPQYRTPVARAVPVRRRLSPGRRRAWASPAATPRASCCARRPEPCSPRANRTIASRC